VVDNSDVVDVCCIVVVDAEDVGDVLNNTHYDHNIQMMHPLDNDDHHQCCCCCNDGEDYLHYYYYLFHFHLRPIKFQEVTMMQ
jgi:hypothetical protein